MTLNNSVNMIRPSLFEEGKRVSFDTHIHTDTHKHAPKSEKYKYYNGKSTSQRQLISVPFLSIFIYKKDKRLRIKRCDLVLFD